ncbi:MAG: bifunctional folylpolyglutamate synthase/dihydrofolate synthase [Deltaproteobacteria bacterium]|nr:bifunctional folylpolyglutamate synthase/dihydrofolate synthase [Deltaproteobacteria bacterium]
MTYAELIRDLWARGHAQGMRLGLDRVEEAHVRLGRPARSWPAVHVAGTNGKGSVAHVAARLLEAHGLRVGLTTSPHLHRLAERMLVDGVEPSADELTAAADGLRARLGGWPPPALTFFESVTLLAFELFRRRAIDVAVVEVGLGGRLDATRLCRPVVSAVVSVGLDHVELLGGTTAEVAAEKAGILVPGVPVLLGPLDREARRVVAARAAALGCPLLAWNPEAGRFEAAEEVHRAWERKVAVPPPVAPLPGAHQHANAALATAAARLALEALDRPPDPARLVPTPFVLPGRLEPIPGRPPVLLDVAHNPAAAAALAAHLAASGTRPRYVLGVLARKDLGGIVAALGACGGPLHACAPALPDARPPAELAAAWHGPVAGCHAAVTEALAAARAAAGPGETVVVTGSHFTVAEARAELLGIADVDRPVAL